ncbi:MAG: S41 family peptidase [Firmicutes bacterium]|nr:S41 family peptidase [Bacillota bacterium]
MATLVGAATYGKGVVQTMFPLSTGGAVKITVAEYLTPAGSRISDVGLQPDHQVLYHALQKEVAWQLLNPDDDPDLSFTAGGEALLNGRETGLVINVLEREGREYLPLRPVLESMLYQVYWHEDLISVMDGDREMSFNTGDGPGSPAIIFQDEISYLAVDLCKQLNINVIKDGNNYKIQRQI